MPAHGFEYPMKIHVDLFQEGASYHTARKRQFFGFKLAFHTLRPWGRRVPCFQDTLQDHADI